ncbi:restriction endonuclease [Clostridium rectalis]|uniref:restriction endonuclease n=1 Tax=Clostridium rectalis TaxID=2040295 RepID=UPI000F64254D|nr:restriction endonuclease [Clostridium rectalis]
MNFFYNINTIFVLALIIYAMSLCVKTYYYIKDKINFNYTIDRLKRGILHIDDLRTLSDIEFIYWCSEFIEKMGFSNINITSDKWPIIKASNGTSKYIIYCKNNNTISQITENEVKTLIGYILPKKIYNIMIITTETFSPSAIKFFKKLPSNYNIRLIDGSDIIQHNELNYNFNLPSNIKNRT